MTDEQANRWSWATTLLCAAYVVWICYVIATRVPAFASLFAGMGGELPAVTAFMLALAKWPIYVVGLILIAGLILKEKLVKVIVVRFAITMIVFMMAAWFGGFALDAMYKPMFEVLEKIG
jgi:ascorbate-specific PTS system EIIC-type component UlaA